MLKKRLEKTALLRNSDGSIYHLNLLPGDLAETIILVGDPQRVQKVSKYFDHIEIKKQKREFITHTGTINGQRISAISSGIGTDNIDIVINECDALHNVDFDKECIKEKITSLRFLRLGTCGGIGKDVSVGRYVLSDFAVGLDSFMSFYEYRPSQKEAGLLTALHEHFKDFVAFQNAYVGQHDSAFSQQFSKHCISGITLTCPGFYGPQYRTLRSPLIEHDVLSIASKFSSEYGKITNVEMETAGIYSLSRLLGHQACSISLVIDNPHTQEVSECIPKSVDDMIKMMLSLI